MMHYDMLLKIAGPSSLIFMVLYSTRRSFDTLVEVFIFQRVKCNKPL